MFVRDVIGDVCSMPVWLSCFSHEHKNDGDRVSSLFVLRRSMGRCWREQVRGSGVIGVWAQHYNTGADSRRVKRSHSVEQGYNSQKS